MPAKYNLIGKRFNSLLVLNECERDHWGNVIWLCKCDCGNTAKVSSNCLVYGTKKSCGCLNKEVNKLINHVGERFGKLIIIRKAEGNRKRWWVRCDCGKEKIVLYGNLKTTTKSCGCYKASGKWYKPNKNTKPIGVAARNSLYDSYKRSAIKRKYSWNISDELFNKLTQDECFYCGALPHRIQKGYNGNYLYNGIDRVDNTIGYEPENVVTCCKTCNRAKDIMSLDQFEKWIKKVFYNSKKHKHGKVNNKKKEETKILTVCGTRQTEISYTG